MLDERLTDNDKKCVYKVGRVVCIGYKNRPIITIGPQWYYSAILGAIVSGLGLMFVVFLSYKTTIVLSIIGEVLIPIIIISLLITIFKDPNMIIIDTRPDEFMLQMISSDERFCNRCSIIREKGTVHCSDCCVCIRNYDHHCIVIGKCIGGGNILYFNIFVFSGLIGMVYLLAVIICLSVGV